MQQIEIVCANCDRRWRAPLPPDFSALPQSDSAFPACPACGHRTGVYGALVEDRDEPTDGTHGTTHAS